MGDLRRWLASHGQVPQEEPHEQWLKVEAAPRVFQASASLVDTAGAASWPSLTDFTLAELRVSRKKIQIAHGFLDQDTKDGGKAAAMSPGIIQEAFPQYQPFRDGDLCDSILQLVMRCWHMRKRKHGPSLHAFVEGFAGEAMITLHMHKPGFRGQRFDLDCHATHNIITHFRTWLLSWIYSKAKALHWTAPPPCVQPLSYCAVDRRGVALRSSGGAMNPRSG